MRCNFINCETQYWLGSLKTDKIQFVYVYIFSLSRLNQNAVQCVFSTLYAKKKSRKFAKILLCFDSFKFCAKFEFISSAKSCILKIRKFRSKSKSNTWKKNFQLKESFFFFKICWKLLFTKYINKRRRLLHLFFLNYINHHPLYTASLCNNIHNKMLKEQPKKGNLHNIIFTMATTNLI